MQLFFVQLSVFQCAVLFSVNAFVYYPVDSSLDVYIIILSHRMKEI